MVPVVQELADVVSAALTAMIRLGFDPDDLLEQQVRKVKSRYPEIWDVT
jgi:NTP pyrophosphatase (non-canonical NTP hydrolase)